MNYNLCIYHEGILDYAKQIFNCHQGPVVGRYVIIQIDPFDLESTERILSLCEIEIFEWGGKLHLCNNSVSVNVCILNVVIII